MIIFYITRKHLNRTVFTRKFCVYAIISAKGIGCARRHKQHNKCRKGKVIMLSEQAKEARRKYKREWARKNPEKVRASMQRYWEKIAKQQHKPEQQAGCQESAAGG